MISKQLLSAAAVACIGCGPHHDYPMAPVSGVVTVDGERLTGGRVMFAPVASGGVKSGKPGFADIRPNGAYVVGTYDDSDGAVAADHWITVLSTDSEDAKKQLLGASRVKFPQRVTVVAGQENEIAVTLTSDDIRRFGEGVD